MNDPTALNYWTLAIAVVGAFTGVAALVTQVWGLVLSGPRVRVEVSGAFRIDGAWFVSLEAINVGRLPVTLLDMGVTFKIGRELKRSPIAMMPQEGVSGPRGGHRLPDAEAVGWQLDPIPIAKTLSELGVRNVRGYVRLATGDYVSSRKRVDVVKLASMEQERRRS